MRKRGKFTHKSHYYGICSSKFIGLCSLRDELLTKDLMQYKIREIRIKTLLIALKTDTELAISAGEMPVQFQSDTIITQSRDFETLWDLGVITLTV